MQTRQVVALVITIAVLALALGTTVGYGISSGKTTTSTITQTGKTSIMTQTEATTVTTSVFLGTSTTTSNSSEGLPTSTYSTFITSVGSQTSFGTLFTPQNTTDIFQFYFDVGINYNGSWNLVYWVEGTNYTLGNLSGSGNFETQITFYAGYGVWTLCANATKLNPQNNLTLTLGVLADSNSTTTSNPMVEVCGGMGYP